MATRSRIGIKNSDGTITSIYCHWYGYVEHNGKILDALYRDETKVRELMDRGDVSSIKFDGTIDSYRDRGETDVDAVVHPDMGDFREYFEEYNYLYQDGEWYVFREEEIGFVNLRLAIFHNESDCKALIELWF